MGGGLWARSGRPPLSGRGRIVPFPSVLRESHYAALSRSDGTCLMFLMGHPGCPSEHKRKQGDHF